VFVAEAVASATSAALPGVDRILITRSDSTGFLPANPPFEKVLTHLFTLPGLMAKAEMVNFLPDEYDSFLFLDTDTRLLADVSFGFQRAEAHGIALVMAPDYSLEHFAAFGRVLAHVGYPWTDTLQYNTGVIFFSRRADVWKVLHRWHELCRTVGISQTYYNDQPFFTLAMEQEGFNPYTLSRGYNYRNFGEDIYGQVRVWHSHYPPPQDVNAFAVPKPPRAFKDSKRLVGTSS
jgi:hypothetical protein